MRVPGSYTGTTNRKFIAVLILIVCNQGLPDGLSDCAKNGIENLGILL
jgi:hypothetical protein